MRMVQLRHRACFAFKRALNWSLEVLTTTGRFNRISRVSEDLPHAAGTDRCNDLVWAEFVAHRKRHG